MEFHPLAKCCHLMSIASGRKSAGLGLADLVLDSRSTSSSVTVSATASRRFSFTPPSPA